MIQNCRRVINRLRGGLYSLVYSRGFNRVGVGFKFFGAKYFVIDGIGVGDRCWFESVYRYKSQSFAPLVHINKNVMFSDNVHISCVKKIVVGEGCLIGSNVYIGDHSHGKTRGSIEYFNIEPSKRLLDEVSPICIGKYVWVGDGVVILAGSEIGQGSIVGANSVVKGKFPPYSLIAGTPAKLIRKLNVE